MNDKVPIQQVLDDMYSDKGPVTWAARDYYYTTYATPEEQKEMDHEDKIQLVIAWIFWIVFWVSIILCIFLH